MINSSKAAIYNVVVVVCIHTLFPLIRSDLIVYLFRITFHQLAVIISGELYLPSERGRDNGLVFLYCCSTIASSVGSWLTADKL